MKRNRIYLLYYDFKHTSGNHAGMAYFAEQFGDRIPQAVLIKHLNQEFTGGRFIAYIYSFFIACYLSIRLRSGDKVLFMEYLSGYFGHQALIARLMQCFRKKSCMIGLVHLSGNHLLSIYGSAKAIERRLRPLAKVVVFGSSLARFIRQIGYGGLIHRTLHFADTEFYTPAPKNKSNGGALHVLFMGNLLRNFDKLEQIILACDDRVVFHVGLGRLRRKMLNGRSNVKVYGYLAETEMLELMRSCDVNLSVLVDTIGSNVITSTLAAGLIQVVSDVGSIRDYCDEGNSFFCHSTMDYVRALKKLSESPELKNQMKANAREKAKMFSLERTIDAFSQLIAT